MSKLMNLLFHPYAAMKKAIGQNAAAVLRTETMFCLFSCMYGPYVTMYMLELGLTQVQVGFLSSFSTALQMGLCLLGAYICDRFGRRRALIMLDLFAWSVPMLMWGLARDFNWFLAASAFNALFRVAMTPFQCFFVESMEPERRVVGFSIMEVVCTAAGFTAPIGAFFVGKLGLVPAMRGLYIMTAISTGIGYIWRYFSTHENPMGIEKQKEMAGVPLGGVMKSYFAAGKRFFTSPALLLVVLLQACVDTAVALRGTWLGNIITVSLGFTEDWPAWMATVGSVVTLLTLGFLLPFITPHAGKTRLLLSAIGVMVIGCFVLLFMPEGSMWLLVAAVVLHTVGQSVINPCLQTLVANEMPARDLAAMNALMTLLLMAFQMPFGVLGGIAASGGNYRGPYWMVLGIYLVCAAILVPYSILKKRKQEKS